MTFPTISKPLAKGITTTEGILIIVTNAILAVAAVLPHGLSWTKTGLYATVLNGVYALSRAIVKAAAIQKGVGIPAPSNIGDAPKEPAPPASSVTVTPVGATPLSPTTS